MVAEFLVIDKTGPNRETQQVGCLFGRKLMGTEKKELINEKRENKICKSRGQCCQGYVVGSLALDDLTLNNLFWSIIIWSINQTCFSAHTTQPDDLLQQ